jgi:hypothetical protein
LDDIRGRRKGMGVGRCDRIEGNEQCFPMQGT